MTTADTRAIELVRRAGIEHRVHAYRPAERHGAVSAGRRGLQLELAPADLARLAGATLAHIERDL